MYLKDTGSDVLDRTGLVSVKVRNRPASPSC